MHQTCRVVPPQSSAEDEAKQLFTFYRDISQNTALIDMTMNIQTAIQRVFQKMNKFLRSWKKSLTTTEKNPENKAEDARFGTKLGR